MCDITKNEVMEETILAYYLVRRQDGSYHFFIVSYLSSRTAKITNTVYMTSVRMMPFSCHLIATVVPVRAEVCICHVPSLLTILSLAYLNRLFRTRLRSCQRCFLNMEGGGGYSALRDNNKLVILTMVLSYRSHPPQEPVVNFSIMST